MKFRYTASHRMIGSIALSIMLASCSGGGKPNGEKADAGLSDSAKESMKETTVLETDTSFYCTLTTPEFRERKKTLVAGLKAKVLERKEVANGFQYKFNGTDELLDKLNEFIKSERDCCGFFTFKVTVTPDGMAWLEISGKDGVKDFITDELEL